MFIILQFIYIVNGYKCIELLTAFVKIFVKPDLTNTGFLGQRKEGSTKNIKSPVKKMNQVISAGPHTKEIWQDAGAFQVCFFSIRQQVLFLSIHFYL